jgi:hypothetical protein
MATDYNSSNPAFEKSSVVGTAANHSTTSKSVAAQDHAQSDDALQDIPPPQDPNISGMTPTEDTHSWLAGPLSAWQENDDYRVFFERGDREVAESQTTHRYNTVHDGDYDDNRGFPTALGHDNGIHGPIESGTGELTSPAGHSPFPLGPVIVRRI